MSWNINKPGDYINGPLTVNGAATIGTVGTLGRSVVISSASASNITIEQTNNASGSHTFDIKMPGWSTDSFNVYSGSNNRLKLTGDGNLLVGTLNNFASSRLAVQGTAGTGTPDVTIGTPVNSGGNTNLAIGRSAATNGYIFLDAYKAAVGGTELVLNSINGGSVLIGLSTVVATGGCLQLKSGITFPATQVASSDANTLDDYEEGTFTPTITASSGTLTTTTVNEAVYTKIGRLVSVAVDISVVNIGTASGQLFFSLPFNQTAQSNVGALRELGATGQMGQIIYQSATQVSAALYNNGTLIVNGYRIRGTYTYTV